VPLDDRLPAGWAIAALMTAGAGLILLAWALQSRLLPLGVPGQWTWEQFKPEEQASWLVFIPAMGLAALLAGWVAWGLSWVERATRIRWLAGLLGTLVLIAAFQVQVEAWSPTALYKWATVLYYENISPPYTVAHEDVGEISQFLRGYDHFLAARPPDHVTTHPPGWFVLYRLLLDLFDRRPALARWIDDWQPTEMSAALDSESERGGQPIGPAARATIATVAVGSRLVAFLGVLPIAWLVRQRGRRSDAWLAAAASGLVPAAILFAPRSDTVYPAVTALLLAVTCFSVRRKSVTAAAGAGMLLFSAMFFSLTFLASAALGVAYVAFTIWREWDSWKTDRRRLAAIGGAALAGWLAGPLLLWLVWRHDIFGAWLTNLGKNSQFNDLYQRTWWPWVAVNLLELALAMGLSASLLLLARGGAGLRGLVRRGPIDALLASWLLIVLLLNFAGVNLGEVARLWLFLMPLGAALAAESLIDPARPRPALAASFVLLQAAACVVLARGLNVLYHAAVAT
jgi:hypothetical protein